MFKIYGIYNCDKIKKIKELLEREEIEFEYIDYKNFTPSVEKIQEWGDFYGELPVNKRGTVYKKIKKQYETSEYDDQVNLMIKNKSCILRPIVESTSGEILAIGGRPERILSGIL